MLSPEVTLLVCLLLIACSGPSLSIITNKSESVAPTDSGKSTEASNVTFHYEANEFLVNKQQVDENKTKEQIFSSSSGNYNNSNRSYLTEPASVGSTSGRNGRMLDLDALTGDFAASRANREHSQTGNRQSRFINGALSANLDLPPGKKLHIQGFIPIIGIKDVSEHEQQTGPSSQPSPSSEREFEAIRKQQRSTLGLQSAVELPYAQSSIGHASFGVQRYLNSEQPPSQKSATTVVDTLKRPFKRLTNGFSQGSAADVPLGQQQVHVQQQQQPDCLCVPFYMCKNGFISESGISKSQHQMLQQQLQQHPQPQSMTLAAAANQHSEATNQFQQQQQMSATQSPQFAESFVSVDERSLDREIITTSTPLDEVLAGYQNETASLQESHQAAAANEPVTVPESIKTMETSNATTETGAKTSDYAQEILGRMLGLGKAPTSSMLPSSASVARVQQQVSSQHQGTQMGTCGLLRSCCSIPPQMLQSNQQATVGQDSAAAPSSVSQVYVPKYQVSQQQQQQQHQRYNPSQSQKFQPSQAMHKSQQLMQTQRIQPYGMPIQQQSGAQYPQEFPLAHRSSQLNNQQQSYGPFLAPAATMQQPMRVAHPAQQQMIQANQQQVKPGSYVQSIANQQLAASLDSQAMTLAKSQQVGKRKVLDGRCGLRQSAGINGRVQNLAYHESSADFGEYPAQAAILKRLSGSDSLFVCGGTLISQYWIATAAHCIKKHSQSEFKVRLGEWDVHRDDEFYPFVEKTVRDVIVHPEFVSGNLVNDIALLRLDSPVDPSLPHVNPACLPQLDESFVREHCWVTGWGKDSFGQKGSFQSVLREVELPVLGQAECESSLRQTRLGPHYRLHSGFICAGGEGGRDACEGDGGSGLYCIQDGIIKVAGLVSWGIGCGQAGVPGVYVNMAHYRSWIENIISIDEDIYSSYSNMIGNNLISERSNANGTDPSATYDSVNSTIAGTTTNASTNLGHDLK